MLLLMKADNPSTINERKYIKHILDIYDRITFYKPSLPMFEIDWRLNLKLQNVLFEHKGTLREKESSFAAHIKFALVHQSPGATLK
jgi:hypothetical protein